MHELFQRLAIDREHLEALAQARLLPASTRRNSERRMQDIENHWRAGEEVVKWST